MPLYYFHVREGERVEIDPEGANFETADQAREEAIKAAREIIAEKVLRGDWIGRHQFEITTDDGFVVGVLPFRSVLRLD
jgi:hypothetical protein